MGIISWILLGLIAGALAKWLVPGRDPGGILVTVLLGIGGALLGGWLGSALFDVDDAVSGFFHLSSWIAAVVGAVILLLLYRLLTPGRRTA